MSEQRLTLSTLEQHLAALQDIEAEVSPEQEAEFQLALKEALTQAVEKRDRVAFVLEHLLERALLADAEIVVRQETIERFRERAVRYRKSADRLRAHVLSVMRELPTPAKGPRRLEGESATLKANGVAPSVEVLDESQVPLEYKRVAVTMAALEWKTMQTAFLEMPGLRLNYESSYTLDRKALLEALKRPCSHCEGDGMAIFSMGPETPAEAPCPKCNGTGKQLIPGARLESDRLRLVIE